MTNIEDVAQAAGVSTATVSRALRGLPNVTPQTRLTVQQAASRLGYVPSRSASALASGRTRTIGLVAPAISRWFFAHAFEGAEHTLRRGGFDALLYSIPDTGEERSLFDPDVLRCRVDAVVVASLALRPAEIERLRSLAVPTVFISVRQPGFAPVGMDHFAGAVLATRHLIELGHRVIGHIGGSAGDDSPYSPTGRRRQGWRRTLAAAGLSCDQQLDLAGDFTAAAGGRAAITLLERKSDLTAIFVASDEMAMGAIQAARERGLVVGRDLSIIGFDGHELGQLLDLTTIAQPAYAQGARAAQCLLDSLTGSTDGNEQYIFPIELVVRASTGPAPG